MLYLHLTQNLSQRQILTQKQLQSLNILQMTGVEMEGVLQNEHLENPMLEYTGTSPQAGAVSWNDASHFDAVSNVVPSPNTGSAWGSRGALTGRLYKNITS